MNQFEEFTKILYNQIQEEEIQGPAEEPNEEINLEEGEDNKINANQSELNKKYDSGIDTSNRLNSNTKRYTTYTMEYKKKNNSRSNNKINNNLIFQVKSKNDEKEVAKIHGINPKTLHRWMTKGLKKNQGK